MYEGKHYVIKFSSVDLGQLLDGLDSRAQAWEKTAAFHRSGVSAADFVVEECSGVAEAERIAKHYRSIICSIIQQTEHQP